MKKISTIVLTLLLAGAMCIPVFAETTDQGDKGVSAATYGQNILTNDLVVTSKTMKVKKTKGLITSIKYPVIREMKDKAIQRSLNDAFLKEAKAALKEGRRAAGKLNKKSVAKCETMMDFSVKYNKNDILSVVLNEYQFAGGAGGVNTNICMNFDLTTGKTITLKSLFADYDKAKSAINESVRAGIDAAKKEGLYELKNFKRINSKQDFYFSAEGLTVVFQQDGPYFSHAAGVQEFTVPYGKLSQYLKTDYVYLALKSVELDAAKPTELVEGQMAYIVIDSNPTTGYTWTVKTSDDKVVKIVKQQYVAKPSTKELEGTGGKEVILVKALSKGTAKVQCTYSSTTGKQDKTVEYEIAVK